MVSRMAAETSSSASSALYWEREMKVTWPSSSTSSKADTRGWEWGGARTSATAASAAFLFRRALLGIERKKG